MMRNLINHLNFLKKQHLILMLRIFFYTLEDDQCTPDGVTKYIKEWRKPQGLPLFKNSK
ncbi:bacteriocin immunity protein [Lonsdalea quercina]|uniref:bacteriocin immunity protein n=1 Tax=Lonsdalea quercina TaxID=71657 RepID=UPI003975AC42